MAGETSAASLRCVSPLASGSTVVACRPAALASSSVAQRYRSPTKISRFYLRYLAYRDILGQNLDILSGPRYLGSDPRYLPYLVISVGALVILPTEISRSKSRYLAWSGPQTYVEDEVVFRRPRGAHTGAGAAMRRDAPRCAANNIINNKPFRAVTPPHAYSTGPGVA